ncbi:MAG: hypothetical protein AAGI63_06790 [Planctomycetota bacterium]
MPEFHLYLYGPSKGPIESSFEAAEERLKGLPKLYFEPDGSFVWALDEGRQQVFGMVYDAAGAIQYIELWGRCERITWQQIVHAATGSQSSHFEVLRLPDQRLQELQDFETEFWPGGADSSVVSE